MLKAEYIFAAQTIITKIIAIDVLNADPQPFLIYIINFPYLYKAEYISAAQTTIIAIITINSVIVNPRLFLIYIINLPVFI